MNLSHRLLQLGKTASNKIDQALPGFGLVGLIYLTADGIFTAKGLGSPFKPEFWHQYGSQLANGDLYRYSGSVYTAAAISSTVLGLVAKRIKAAKEYSQMALGVLAGAASLTLLAAAVQAGDWATAGSAVVLSGANGLLLSGTKLGEKIVDPIVNTIKKRKSEFNAADTMATAFVVGNLPMYIDAVRKRDKGLAVVATLWTVAAFIARSKMKNQPAPSL
jgi:hypothetical protein